MLKVKNLSNQTTAVLRNAYNVSYEKPVNQIWSAGFSLPLKDPTRKKVKLMNFLEMRDKDGEYIGLFRIMSQVSKTSSSGQTVDYDCLHVLSTLMDSAISGYHQTKRGWTTRQVIEWILNFQDVKHWQLGRCDFTRYFEYSFENENGLASALFSITEGFAEEYMWTYDTTSYPWTINLIKPDTKPVCRIREGWNLKDLTVEENASNLINRLTFLGKGDGINNLNFKKINGGKDYVEDAGSRAEYGLIEYIKKDERFINEESLLESARGLLESAKRPKVTWKTTAIDLIKSIPTRWTTTKIPEIDRLRSGQVVQLWTSLFGVTNLRIMNEKKTDVFGDPGNIQLDINYISGDITTTTADLERQLEIYKLSSVGATNKDTVSFFDNADEDKPLPVPVFFEDELKKINKVILTFKTDKYRAYSRATKGGGALIGSTAAGGYTASSTAGGGASVQGGTSQSGGASVQSSTSTANGSHDHTTFKYAFDNPTDIDQLKRRAYYAQGTADLVVIESTGTNNLNTNTRADNHTHNVSINIPAHNHGFSVNIPSHKHDFTVPAHSHQIELPDHTHDIDYGIFEDDQMPDRIEVLIDNQKVTEITSLNADRLDVTRYFYTDDGKITRGWHEVVLKPIGARARFTGQCTVYGFIGSIEGGEL
ncbi:phage tail spike protein [Enterococcus sp. 2201sp1_2201st1_B8_2201SCRN_220225]|uniref:phage tail spike protein n=1 Tax=unclassified Enterococcus TaxID=2608891 RepID=UPI0034A0DCA8